MIGPTDFGILAFSSIFAMVDPLAAAPIFVNMTRNVPEARRRLAIRSIFAAGIAMIIFATIGAALFKILGITVEAFQIVGGLLFLLTSLRALQGLEVEERVESDGHDIAVVPLGIPVIAGAGVLSTVMVLSGQARQPGHQVALFLAMILALGLTLLILFAAPRIIRFMGKSGQHVMSKLVHLLTAIIGMQFILNGTSKVITTILQSR